MIKINLKSRYFLRAFLVLLFATASFLVQAQDPGLVCGDGGSDPDIDCPIDGGVVILLAAGVALGIKKLALK